MQLCLCARLLPSAGVKLHSSSASGTLLSSLNPSISYISILSLRVQLLCKRPFLHLMPTVSSSCCPGTSADSCGPSYLPFVSCRLYAYLTPTQTLWVWDPSQGLLALMILIARWRVVGVLLATSNSFEVSACAWHFCEASFQLTCSLGGLNTLWSQIHPDFPSIWYWVASFFLYFSP